MHYQQTISQPRICSPQVHEFYQNFPEKLIEIQECRCGTTKPIQQAYTIHDSVRRVKTKYDKVSNTWNVQLYLPAESEIDPALELDVDNRR